MLLFMLCLIWISVGKEVLTPTAMRGEESRPESRIDQLEYG